MHRGNLLLFISSVFVVVTTFECGKRVQPKRQKRIANGYEAGHWPWMVHFQKDMDEDGDLDKWCGGSVIGSRWVLTAQHCFEDVDADEIHMIIGESVVLSTENDKSMVHRDAVSIILYDDLYNYTDVDSFRAWRMFGSWPNDVAIIELDQPLDFTEHIRPICLPSKVDPIYKKGAELFTIGHGDTHPYDASNDTLLSHFVKSYILQEMKHIAEDPAHCKERLLTSFKEDMEKEKEEYGDFDRMAYLDEEIRLNICTKEKGKVEGTCRGDSGGPLMLKTDNERWFQFGINSYGTTGECGHPEEIEVYASVVKYCEFIALATNDEVTCVDVK